MENLIKLTDDELYHTEGGMWRKIIESALRSEIASDLKELAVYAYDEFMEGWNSVEDYKS